MATRLHQFLSDPSNANAYDGFSINKVILVQQDKYFYPRDSPHHKWIPEINHINREILSAMDMDQFADDVDVTVRKLKTDNRSMLSEWNGARMQLNIMIIEGFLIFNDERINKLCQLRFHIYLSYDVGYERRLTRNFKHINSNPKYYYEHYIWPMYQKHLGDVPNKANLIFINGEKDFDDVYNQTNEYITKFLIS